MSAWGSSRNLGGPVVSSNGGTNRRVNAPVGRAAGSQSTCTCTDEAGEPTRGTRRREGGCRITEPQEGKADGNTESPLRLDGAPADSGTGAEGAGDGLHQHPSLGGS